jgi:hypothetical protein
VESYTTQAALFGQSIADTAPATPRRQADGSTSAQRLPSPSSGRTRQLGIGAERSLAFHQARESWRRHLESVEITPHRAL